MNSPYPVNFPPPGLKAWYKADTLSLNDGDAVATWPDASGNGNDLTQATVGKQPIFKASILNGHPVVRFDAVDDYLEKTSFNLASNMVVLFVSQRAGTSFGSILACGDFWLVYQDNTMWDYPNLHASTLVTGWNQISFSAELGVKNKLGANGFLVENSVTNKVTGTTLTIGNDKDHFYPLGGDIAEIMIIDCASPNTSQNFYRKQAVEQYLARKYGLTVGQPIRANDNAIDVWVDGDSISAAPGLVTQSEMSNIDLSWSSLLQRTLGPKFRVHNVAVSAQTLDQMSADAATEIDANFTPGAILFAWEYANTAEGVLGHFDGATVYSKAVNYYLNRKAAGFKVISASDFHNSTGSPNDCQIASDLVRANWTSFSDGFVELNLQSLRDDAAIYDPDFLVHLDVNGFRIVADAVAPVVARLAGF